MNYNNIPLIDLYSFTQRLGDGVYDDYVHYTPETCKLQAAFIAGRLLGMED